MAENLKTGDVVQLKSGGPKMTVNGSNTSGSLNCAWFDKDLKVFKESFYPASLEKVEK